MTLEPMQLRPYQREAVAAVIAARRAGVRRMVLALPTGAGKTVIFSDLIRRAKHPVLVLAHRDELLHQARAKIEQALRLAGDRRRVELERGGERASRDADIIVASLRSLHGSRLGRALAGRDIRLVIYDECHHAVADDNRRILDQIGALANDWPGTLVGFTATTMRADGRGLGEVFEQIVYQRSLSQMINDGYLRPLRGYRVVTDVCLDGVAVRGEDFDEEQLEQAVDVETRNMLVARSIQELTRDRRTIAFCVTVRHAQNLGRALRRVGVRAGIVCGEMPAHQRRHTLARFAQGHFDVITNVGVLTEGFDDPGVSAIAMVRPTRSTALYLQCVGRGMRLSDAAQDCLVLDFVDLSKLELVTVPTLDASDAQVASRDDAPSSEGSQPEVFDELDTEAPATLGEIQARLVAFDPLTLELQREAAAISANAWISLGAKGMVLHFTDRGGDFRTFELIPEEGRRRGTAIVLDQRRIARESTMQAGIEAVDHELANYGDPASARPQAAWRQAAVPDPVARALAGLRPPRHATTVGEALAHLALARALPAVPRARS